VKLLTTELRARLPLLYAQEKVPDPIVAAAQWACRSSAISILRQARSVR